MLQIIEQTDDQKEAMYMKLPKKKIISMLIECNKIANYQHSFKACCSNCGITEIFSKDNYCNCCGHKQPNFNNP